jgi:hypothetical protein
MAPRRLIRRQMRLRAKWEFTMSRVGGYLFIVAGVTLAAPLLPIPSGTQNDRKTSELRRALPDWRTWVATGEHVADTHSSSVVEQPPPAAQPSDPIVVTIQQGFQPAQMPQVSGAHIPSDRAALVRDLQRELRRVGCYTGAVDGIWNTSTLAAMKAFTGRVNAVLPLERPDAILLSLVRSHQGQGCASCPSGQTLVRDGRCMPIAFPTQATTRDPPKEKPAPAISGWTTITTASTLPVPQPSLTDRMALAGPSTGTSAPTSAAPSEASQIKHARGSRTQERHGSLKPTVSRRSRFVETVFSRNSPY